MVAPVAVPIGTPYGRRGSYWSCKPDANGNGIHTGVDFPAGTGTKVVAARPGKVVYCNHGSAFGYHQLEILPGDGTRDFYAHMRSRAVADGAHVDVGQKVGEVDSEGNVTGPHLHFERHNVATGGWSCSVVVNPQPSIDYKAPEPPAPKPPEEPMPTWIRATHNTDTPLQAEVWKSVSWEDVPNGGDFINDGEASIRISGKMYMATLVASFDARPPADNPQATLRTRFVEREKQGDKWVDVEEYTAIEHPFTSGGTVVSDTRVQKVTDGRLLVAQVYAPSGGVLTSANINLLTF